MNTEELRKEFEGWAESNCYILDLDEDGDYENNLTFSAFEAYQAAKAQPQWIPVSERLPEYGVAVFVVIDGIFKLIPFKRVCFGGVWWWESVISSTCMLYDINDVTHWMPLPSAPEQNK